MSKKELKWLDAIAKVLEDEKKSLNYTEIAELISEREYRISVGATPANTVNAYINGDIKDNKDKSIFAKVDKGEYILRKFLDIESELITDIETTEIIIGKQLIIEALGIYWNRTQVLWKPNPDLFGVQQIGATPVNFSEQVGIYLLHDSRETIYVGQAIDQTIGKRLYQHTMDRFSGRWDRFSWFGFYCVSEKGGLTTNKKTYNELTIQQIADALEAILIESIEPRQNRKKGNTFSGIEYLQQEDPEIKKKRTQQILQELTEKI
ncbi:MAG: HTH domain-containing protein [Bacteroidetes bacterium]|nr:HTH domain-containing protein [Bacteroidota bacterium]